MRGASGRNANSSSNADRAAHPAMSMCAHCTFSVSTYCCRKSAAVMLPAYLLPAFCKAKLNYTFSP